MAFMEADVLLIKDAESLVEMSVNLMNKPCAVNCEIFFGYNWFPNYIQAHNPLN